VTKDYCEQVVAESRVVTASGAVSWVELRKANHYLDCEAGNTAVAHSLGLHRRGHRRKQASEVAEQSNPEPHPGQTADSQPGPAPQNPFAQPPQQNHWAQQTRRKNWTRSW
jgi:hypothetical protein